MKKPDMEVALFIRARMEGCCSASGYAELEILAYPSKTKKTPDYDEVIIRGKLSWFAKQHIDWIVKMGCGLPNTKANKEWSDELWNTRYYYQQEAAKK